MLSAPDFIANAGGVICAAMEYHKATEGAAMQTVAEKVRTDTEEVLAEAKRRRGVPPRRARRIWRCVASNAPWSCAAGRCSDAGRNPTHPPVVDVLIAFTVVVARGAKTASRCLGRHSSGKGSEVQDAPRYGAERRGAPIFAYVRA